MLTYILVRVNAHEHRRYWISNFYLVHSFGPSVVLSALETFKKNFMITVTDCIRFFSTFRMALYLFCQKSSVMSFPLSIPGIFWPIMYSGCTFVTRTSSECECLKTCSMSFWGSLSMTRQRKSCNRSLAVGFFKPWTWIPWGLIPLTNRLKVLVHDWFFWKFLKQTRAVEFIGSNSKGSNFPYIFFSRKLAIYFDQTVHF